MRKWLIILAGLTAIIFGVLWWLGNSLDKQKPSEGDVRMEIEHVF